MRIAALDVGTNSVHMIVAEVDGFGHFRVLDRAKEMVRLGRGSLGRGRLERASMDQGVRTLAAFKTLAERQGVTRMRTVATSAVREARNGGEFLQRVQDEVGLRVKVIPGREEARLIGLAVAQAIDLGSGRSVIVDIGGGSVEMIAVDHGRPTSMYSLKLGVARLTEAFFRRDPPGARALERLDAHLDAELDPALASIAAARPTRVIATSGTMLSLVAMAAHRLGVRPGRHLHGLQVPASEITRLARALRKADRETRLAMKGLDAKRVDLIAAGAIVADRVVRRLKPRSVVACTWALREGILIDYLDRHGRGIRESAEIADVRRRSVVRLLRRLGQSDPHNEHVARLALRIFDQLRDDLGLEAEAREWLEYAALLHDVGHVIDHENHHVHSHYLIVHGELFGFSREEVEIIGLAARLHHRKGGAKVFVAPGDEGPALSGEARRAARALGAILRVAEGLDRSRYGAVTDVRVVHRGGALVLDLKTDGQDAALEIWEASRRCDLLEKVVGREVRVRFARSR